MRQKIIQSLDIIVWIFAGLIAVGGVIMGFLTLFQGAILPGLGMIIGALLYAIIFAGMFFLLIGVHENTKRTAEALERQGR